ncbi:uncharacterized protein LOC118208637 [Anguilla anguilla]|uniref:uncharacterized protein LOC118208637 n=1 Tax=Anguilla anguilla TaxID=7936 RepID=UPI0015A823D2|nr:uncharacterized protein LOC118208637 [Anguilla anguilla]
MFCIYMLLLLSGQICLFFMESVVGERPNITLRPPTGEVIEGQNFTITCHSQYTGGHFHLEFNGVNLTTLSYPNSFSVASANSSNSGNYSCVYVSTSSTGHHNISRSDMVIVKVTVKSEFPWVLIVAGSAGGAVFLLLLILLSVCLTCKCRTHSESVARSTYHSQPLDREDLESEPDYVDTPSEGSGTNYLNVEMQGFGKGCTSADAPSEDSNASYVNVEIPEEEESECEDDYVNTETMQTGNAPVGYGDSDSEPDYENSAYVNGDSEVN